MPSDTSVTSQRIGSIPGRSRSRARRRLRAILAVVAAGAAVASGPLPSSGAEQGIAARVNGEPVTRVEVTRLLEDPLARRSLEQEFDTPNPDAGELERIAVRKLIQRRLLLQEAGRRKVTVTEKELDQALTALRSRFKDLEGFGAWMHERGLDDKSLFDTLRVQILTGRVWSALSEGVRLTEEEVRGYYAAHREELTIGEEVRLRIIAVGSSAAGEEILAALRKGENFGRLARNRSMGMRAAQGGDTGWVDFRTLPPLLQEVAVALQPGDVGGPVQREADEFLIVGLQGRRPLLAKSLDEARPEIERRILPEKRREAVQEWLEKEEKKAKIELFAGSESSTNGQNKTEAGRGGS